MKCAASNMAGRNSKIIDMKKPRALPQKRQIKQHIKTMFAQYRNGETFKTEAIIKYCKRRMGIKVIFGDTILRYVRELRSEGVIDYEIKCRQSRIVRVIK